jgi:hypothetical protein
VAVVGFEGFEEMLDLEHRCITPSRLAAFLASPYSIYVIFWEKIGAYKNYGGG